MTKPRFVSAISVLLVMSSLAAPPPAAPAEPLPTNAVASVLALSRPADLAVLRVEDTISVRVYQEPDLDALAKINSQGTVSLPLLGEVNIVGRTPEDVARVIRELYAADFLVNPQVTVSVTERAKRRFTVLGQVSRPGMYEFPAEEGAEPPAGHCHGRRLRSHGLALEDIAAARR